MKINTGDAQRFLATDLNEFSHRFRRTLFNAIANDSLDELLDSYDLMVPITDFTNYKYELAIAEDINYSTAGALYNTMPKYFAWTLVIRALHEFEMEVK